MGNSKRIAFRIVITLNNNSATVVPECHNLKYKFSRNHTDKLEITGDTITISGSRSGKPNLDEIFTNNQSEVYFQVIKSYIYYCVANGNIFKILKIECHNNDDAIDKVYSGDEIRNLNVSNNAPNIRKINKAKAAIIFEATPESNKYLYAMSTLIRSLCSDDNNDIFEKIWKSYNSIYRVISNEKQEVECLNEMGREIIRNPANYPLSVNAAQAISGNDISDSTRWWRMLENKFIIRGNKKTRENNFSTFLTQYQDFRLNEVSQRNVDIEKNFWTNSNLKTTTINDIANKINNNQRNDAEVVDAICNHYAYFLRNKTLHGDQTDHSFRFIPYNKEEKTLKFTSNILFLLVCDLINSHTLQTS
ncbi:hypothetical protein QL137_01940 [Escherichia coli]|nr:hypothetical protein QL137_01940 [Escherichia coli]